MDDRYQCRECGDVKRTFFDQDELDVHQRLRHGAMKDYMGKLKYPKKPLPAGATEFERAWDKLHDEQMLHEDLSDEHQALAGLAREKCDLLAELGNLDGYGKATRQQGSKATKGKGKKKAPAGKPFWDSKHGRWSATDPKATKGNQAARQQGSQAKEAQKAARRPVGSQGGVKPRSTDPVYDDAGADEPAGPD